MSESYPKLAQGQAVPASADDLIRDEAGITDPNLHRRIDNECTPKKPSELLPDQYTLTVAGVNSYRTTKHTVHKEDSTDSEIP